MTGILVPVILAMVLLTVISAGEAEMLISEQTQEWMRAELTASEASIIRELSVISNTVNNISGTISSGYKSTTQYNLEKALQQVVAENDSIYGSGIWFEPNVFKVSAEYMGPYAYWTGERKDGEKEVAVTTAANPNMIISIRTIIFWGSRRLSRRLPAHIMMKPAGLC